MATTLQFIAYDTTSLSGLVGSARELYVDTSKATVVVMDGVTPGGSPLVTERSLSSQLTSYSTVSYLTSVLVSYPTNVNLTSTLTNYPTNSNFTSTLTNYPTNTNFTSTLTNYPTNSNFTSTLTNYPTNTNFTSTLASYPTNANLTSTLASYPTNVSFTSTLSSYATKTFVTSALTSYATIAYVTSSIAAISSAGASGSIATLNLGDGFVFYSGASASTLTGGTSFSSAQISAYSSSLFIINPTPAVITSITNTALTDTIIFAKTSSVNTSYEISFKVDSTPTYTTGDPVQVTLYNSGYGSPYTINPGATYTASTTSNASKVHTLYVVRAAFPQFVILTEGTDFTVTGTLITVNTTVTFATSVTLFEADTGPAGLTIPVTATSGSSAVWNYNDIQFTELSVGYTSSESSTYTGTAGRLVYTNPNGVQYFSDGSIAYPNGFVTDSSGSVILKAGSVIKDDLGTVVIDTATSYTTTTYVSDYVSSALVGYSPGGGTTSATTYGGLTSAVIVAGALTLDYSSTVVLVDHNKDITSVTVVNGPSTSQAATITVILTQDSTTGNNIITGSFKTSFGAGLNDLDLTTGAVNVVTFLATNISGTTTLYGFPNAIGAI